MERLDVSASMLYPKIFLRSNKKYFFERTDPLKKKQKKNVPILDFGKDSYWILVRNPYQNPIWARFFFIYFLGSLDYYFLLDLRKFFGYSIDAETSNLSIYDVFDTFGGL